MRKSREGREREKKKKKRSKQRRLKVESRRKELDKREKKRRKEKKRKEIAAKRREREGDCIRRVGLDGRQEDEGLRAFFEALINQPFSQYLYKELPDPQCASSSINPKEQKDEIPMVV